MSTADIGTLQRTPSGFEGQLTRQLDHDAVAVWRMLTDPLAMAAQMAGAGSVERAGGTVHIDFADSGTVIDSCVAPLTDGRLLAYSWSSGSEPERPMRWGAGARNGGTRLTLTLQIPPRRTPPRPAPASRPSGHAGRSPGGACPSSSLFQRFLQARGAYTGAAGG